MSTCFIRWEDFTLKHPKIQDSYLFVLHLDSKKYNPIEEKYIGTVMTVDNLLPIHLFLVEEKDNNDS
jgi:hypothetical protein